MLNHRAPLRLRAVLSVVAGLALAVAPAHAQKPTLTPADYGQWETLGFATLSPRWPLDRLPVSRVNGAKFPHPVDEDSTRTVFGSRATFSDDSRWLAYSIGISRPSAK